MRTYHFQLPQESFQLLLVSPQKTKMQFAQEHHLDYPLPYQTFGTRLGDIINLNALFKQISLPNYCTITFNSASVVTCDRPSDFEYSDKLAVTCDNGQSLASLLFYLHKRRPHTVDNAKVAAMDNESVVRVSNLLLFASRPPGAGEF
jgi:hypothetical protein